MDIDLSQSDLSRLTTMLSRVGAAFERSYGPHGTRIIELGGVCFEFNPGLMLTLASVPT